MEDALEVQKQTIPTEYAPLIAPLPFFPALGKLLSGVTISIVVCYLEIHHPAPASDFQSFAGHANPPIYLDCDRAAAELGVSRRTLHLSLCCIGTWYRVEGERERSARAGREFLNPLHTRHGKIKPYSITGSKAWRIHRILAIRRNLPHLHRVLAEAGLTICRTVPDCLLSPLSQTPSYEQFTSIEPLKLVDVLENACGIKPDRRVDRWERARLAKANREVRAKS
jgi:hypothetical protein